MRSLGLGKRRRAVGADREVDPEAQLLVDAMERELGSRHHHWPYAEDIRSTSAWDAISVAPPTTRVQVAIEALWRGAVDPNGGGWRSASMLTLGQEVLRRKLDLQPEDRVALLEALMAYARQVGWRGPLLTADWDHTRSVLRALERGGPVDRLPAESTLLHAVRAALVAGESAAGKRCIPRVDALLGVTIDSARVFANPDWCATALEDSIQTMPSGVAEAASDALRLAVTASSSKPPRRFIEGAADLVRKHGDDHLTRAIVGVLQGGALPVTSERGLVDTMTGDALRGLCWIASTLPPTQDLAAAVGLWVVTGWRKIPDAGARCRKGASGALWALSRLGEPGAAELGRARALVKQPQAVRDIDAAIGDAAHELGIPVQEFEERVVPTYGLDAGAVLRVPLGSHTATIATARGKAAVTITGPDGRPRKSVPAVIRQEYGAELADLRSRAKNVTTMLAAQRFRLERLLMDERSWEPSVWRSRYLMHPLVSVVARPLIWQVVGPAGRRTFVAPDGEPHDLHGTAVSFDVDDRLELWHPATAPTAEVESWRLRIEELGLVQPFKQAHREVYLLTDAERTTDMYSNRFAGHILRQHQFAALARARSWRYGLQGEWDQPDDMARLSIGQHDLIAGFWVDRPWDAEGDENESGVFNHVLSDQVRFTTSAGNDVHLDDVPARVLSEVFRDVDLFVGVSSIGNDPGWRDSGDARRTWDRYWTSYSFGELGAAAETRRDLLGRLLPKLSIRDVAWLEQRFLVVKGSLRTYKIHLGSGNILMEPNDQYLCIVPGRDAGEPREVMLPFEGDRMLSIVLSKAMLLAEDERITDRTITSQITRR